MGDSKLRRARRFEMRAVIFCVTMFALAGFVLADQSAATAKCTVTQNQAKINTGSVALNCGKAKCGHITSDAEAQAQCICNKCQSEEIAAEAASCVCGLNDPNSAQACSIYHKLLGECTHVKAKQKQQKEHKTDNPDNNSASGAAG